MTAITHTMGSRRNLWEYRYRGNSLGKRSL